MQNIRNYAIECLQEEAKALLGLIPQLTEDFENAVSLIHHCKGKLIVTGVGKSGHIGAKIAATLASTGTPSFFVNPLDAYHGDLGMISSEDVVLALSNSGCTEELLRFIPNLLERKIPIISITSKANSLLARYSNYHLNASVEKEACPLNLAPTCSTTATLALGDALAVALMKVRNFKASDFAQFHPGGSLGRKLLAKVKDVMFTQVLPKVCIDTPISEVIFTLSSSKQSIAVVIENNKVIGVVTDGDIRRAMQKQRDVFFDLKVSHIMSHNPKTINENVKLTKAEQVMKQNKVHSLVVLNDAQEFVGLIDYFLIESE